MTVEETKNRAVNVIRQAIAFDDIDALKELETFSLTDITLNDISTAATIQSFKVLEWMLTHSTLSNSDIIYLLKQQKNDPYILKCLVDNLTCFAISRKALNNIIQSNELANIDQILNSSA